MRSRERSSALHLGRETAEAVSEVEGKSAEYVEAVRKVRRVEHSLVGLRAVPAGAAPGWRPPGDSGCRTHEWPSQPLWALLCTVRHWDLLAGTGRRGLGWLEASSKLQRRVARAARACDGLELRLNVVAFRAHCSTSAADAEPNRPAWVASLATGTIGAVCCAGCALEGVQAA